MNIWWIVAIVVVVISIPVILFFRLGFQMKREDEEIERAGGFDKWSKSIKDQIAENDKRIQQNNEIVRQNDEIIRRSNEVVRRSDMFSNALSTLEQQLKQNLFSDIELAEIAKDKAHSEDLALLSVETSEQLIELVEQQTKLIGQRTKLIEQQTVLINKPISKENNEKIKALDAEIKTLDAKAKALDAKAETADKKVIACNEKLFASYDKIKQWVELGKTRAAKQTPGA